VISGAGSLQTSGAWQSNISWGHVLYKSSKKKLRNAKRRQQADIILLPIKCYLGQDEAKKKIRSASEQVN